MVARFVKPVPSRFALMKALSFGSVVPVVGRMM
ncbi:MAG: hypothetical protein GXY70_06300 [Euryarchaeota archaeon]|nr:hypothetical protein [Euryarchaeota archaeon]